jgi:hypothetical protein
MVEKADIFSPDALIRFSRGCEAIKLMDETIECVIYNVVRRMLINTSINR